MFDLLSLQGLKFLLQLPTIVDLRMHLDPNFLTLLRMPQLVLSHTHWQGHLHKIEHGVYFFGIFPLHWSIALTNRESQSMLWLIMHAGQVIGGGGQSANIKIQKSGEVVPSYSELIPCV